MSTEEQTPDRKPDEKGAPVFARLVTSISQGIVVGCVGAICGTLGLLFTIVGCVALLGSRGDSGRLTDASLATGAGTLLILAAALCYFKRVRRKLIWQPLDAFLSGIVSGCRAPWQRRELPKPLRWYVFALVGFALVHLLDFFFLRDWPWLIEVWVHSLKPMPISFETAKVVLVVEGIFLAPRLLKRSRLAWIAIFISSCAMVLLAIASPFVPQPESWTEAYRVNILAPSHIIQLAVLIAGSLAGIMVLLKAREHFFFWTPDEGGQALPQPISTRSVLLLRAAPALLAVAAWGSYAANRWFSERCSFRDTSLQGRYARRWSTRSARAYLVPSFPNEGGAYIVMASERGDVDSLRALLPIYLKLYRRNVLTKDVINDALCRAIIYEKHDAVDYLLSRNADVSASGRAGWNAMYFAALYGRTQMMRRLLARGHKVSPPPGRPAALGVAAVHSGNIELLELLISEGVDLKKEGKRFSPYYYAVASGRVEMIRYLEEIGFGEMLSLRGKFGNNLLQYYVFNLNYRPMLYRERAERNAPAVVDYLLSKGIDISFRNDDGETAWDIATPGMRKILEARGAIPTPDDEWEDPTQPSEADQEFLDDFLKEIDEFEKELKE